MEHVSTMYNFQTGRIKKIVLTFLFSLMGIVLFAQQRSDAEKLVTEGVALEDSGKSDQAISYYQQALELDKDNLMALSEMAYSLMSLKKYNEAIRFCKRAIKTHKGNEGLNTIYVSYGNALDALKQPENSIEIYNEGIRQFPDYFQLYFNKGISLAGIKKNDEAILCFERSAALNPNHAGTQNALGNVLLTEHKKIPALMAYGRFLVIEPETDRSVSALANLQKILNGNVTVTGDHSIAINVSPDMLSDKAGKQTPNNFSSIELLLAMRSALDYDSTMKNTPEVEKCIKKFEVICSSLKNSEKDNYGFYWDYYAPYYIEMNDRNLLETFAYIAFASSQDKAVVSWLTSHKTDIEHFYKWSDAFTWRIN